LTVRCLGKQVLGVYEPSACLPEALRSFLLTESENIDTLLTDAGSKAGMRCVIVRPAMKNPSVQNSDTGTLPSRVGVVI